MTQSQKQQAQALWNESIAVLKDLQRPSGGWLASYPGERYPFVYPRDHAMCVLGALAAGMQDEARKGVEFFLRAVPKSGMLPQRFDESGKDVSYKPPQIDGNGLLLYVLAHYTEETGDESLIKKYRAQLECVVRHIEKSIDKKRSLVWVVNSIHELPMIEEGFELWGNATCAGGLKAFGQLPTPLARRAGKLAATITRGMGRSLWNRRLKSFIKTVRVGPTNMVLTHADASVYAVTDFGLLADTDVRVQFTVARLHESLWHPTLGGLCRYPEWIGRNNGGWGPWPHFTLMLARHFIRRKKRKEADRYLGWVLRIAYHNRLPEHLATKQAIAAFVSDGRDAGIIRKDHLIAINHAKRLLPYRTRSIAYVTCPLAWPHAEFLRTWRLHRETFR